MPDANDQATLYALGALAGAELDEFERLLASGHPEAAAEVERLQAAIEYVVSAAPTPPPRADLKDRLLASVSTTKPLGFEEPAPGVHVLRAGNGRWKQTGHPGVSVKILHLDKESRMATTILRLDPGAKYPPHHHAQLEQCLVISGDVRFGAKVHIHAGDYEKALPGTDHEFLTSDAGCELLILSSIDDEIHSAPAASSK